MIIHKYQFPKHVVDGSSLQVVELPFGVKILTAQIQHDFITLWYLVSSVEKLADHVPHVHRFAFYATGYDEVPINARYMNTFQFDDGRYVLHMFELT